MSTRRKIGLVLAIIGLMLTLGLIFIQMYDAHQTWYGGLNGKNQSFDSWFAYFMSYSKGAIIVYLVAGAMLYIPGCFLLFAPKSRTLFKQNAPQPPHSIRNNRGIM
jgi:hypothetical protein